MVVCGSSGGRSITICLCDGSKSSRTTQVVILIIETENKKGSGAKYFNVPEWSL